MAYASLIGAPVTRKQAPRVIVGRGAYIGDMKLAGMQSVAFVRTPSPTASASANAVVAALAHLGVTAMDIPMRPERVWRTIAAATAIV